MLLCAPMRRAEMPEERLEAEHPDLGHDRGGDSVGLRKYH